MHADLRIPVFACLISVVVISSAHAQVIPQPPGKCEAPIDATTAERECSAPADLRRLGESYGSKGDHAEARKWLRKAAEAGDTQAMLDLGYDNGSNRAETAAEQLSWLRKAADAGDSRGATAIEWDYKLGRQGLAIDPTQAKLWHARADDLTFAEDKAGEAKYGDGPIPHRMDGYAYALARHFLVHHDADEAIKWFNKAADAGDDRAVAHMQRLYATGTPDIPADPIKAKIWQDRWQAMQLKKRIAQADAGDTYAMAQLGMAYLGKPTDVVTAPKDDAEGIRWLRRSAEAGNPDAAAELSKLYAAGDVVERDPVAAAQWSAKAVAGNPSAYAPVEQLIKAVDKDPQPLLMLLIARRMVSEHRRDEAVFWYVLGSFRGETFVQTHPEAAETLGDGESAVATDLHEAHMDGADLIPVIDRVLAWDQAHPDPYAASPAAREKARSEVIAERAKLIAKRDKAKTL